MYIIEGNIGVGKSTFLSLIQKFLPSVQYTLEPVDTWAKKDFGTSLLEQFYAVPTRWAYTIETLAMVSRSRDHLAVQDLPPHHLVERSIYSGHYCFALNGKREGYFHQVEWDAYLQWATFIIDNKCKAPHGFIYLKADPDVCYARVGKRQRSGESMISLDYLRNIHFWHEQFLTEKKGIADSIADVPVLTLDANIDFIDNSARMHEHARRIATFMHATSGRLPAYQQPPSPQVALNR